MLSTSAAHNCSLLGTVALQRRFAFHRERGLLNIGQPQCKANLNVKQGCGTLLPTWDFLVGMAESTSEQHST